MGKIIIIDFFEEKNLHVQKETNVGLNKPN